MNEIKESPNWPEEVRLEMIRKSEYYDNDKIYQYGYYDGYQKAIAGRSAAEKEIAEKDKRIREWSKNFLPSLTNDIHQKAKQLLKQ